MSLSLPQNLLITLITPIRFYLLYKPFPLILKYNRWLHQVLFKFVPFIYSIHYFNVFKHLINFQYLSI